MKNLTVGKPWKVILLFTIPIMLGSIFQQLYNLADSKIVSTYVGTAAFAAVGATSVVANIIIAFVNGIAQGFAIPVANSYGAGDEARMRRYIAGSIILTAGVAVTLTAAALLSIEKILMVLDTPQDIFEDALSYVRIILVGIVFIAVYNLCANILRAVGDSKTPLYCLIISVITNIFLDIFFVKTLDLGIKGAAYATLAAQALAGGLCIIYIVVRFKTIIPRGKDFMLEKGQYKELITTGLAMGLMGCIVNIGTVVLQGAINNLGTEYVAAHTAARKLFDILTVMLYSVGIAMTTYVSQNVGANKPERVKQGIAQTIIYLTGVTTVLIAVCFVFGERILRWITSTDNKTIIDAGVMYSRISILFFFVLGPLFILRCSLQGMGRKVIPVCSSILEMVIKILSASFLVPRLEYVGVAFTEPISWVVMTILLATDYLTKGKKQLNAMKGSA